ncbi:flagellar hook-length control protein FliK [Desulfogranum japonicum]|uniref:flagellar hook-length control protein FliK n=1 Tax=Desulfogranum japonicum TaxID=231447 RepID=UPI000408401F|nr:flagellar hook-length control protein FliK [Desulfogranum japonicum]
MQTFAFSAAESIAPIKPTGNTSAGNSRSSASDENSFASHLATQSARQSSAKKAATTSTSDRTGNNEKTAATVQGEKHTNEKVSSDTANVERDQNPSSSNQEDQTTSNTVTPDLNSNTDATSVNDENDDIAGDGFQEALSSEIISTYMTDSEARIISQVLEQTVGKHDSPINATPNTITIPATQNPITISETTNTAVDNTITQVDTNGNVKTNSTAAALLFETPGTSQYHFSRPAAAGTGEQVTLTTTQLQQIIDSMATPTATTATTATAASQPLQASQETAGQQVVVEQWSATFANTQQTAQNKGMQQQTNGLLNNSPQLSTQTAEGQVITVYQSTITEEVAAKTMASGQPLTTDPSGQRQDATSNYIHSNLPNNSVKAVLNEQEQQLADDTGQQNNPEKGFTGEQLHKTETLFRSDNTFTPLNFDSQSPSTSSTSQASATTTTMMRLPSGATVPESSVMDQVVHYFNNNRKLESGSVTLSLHPRELGELRMEIKVDQDNIRAHITTQTPQAQEALDRHLPKLREALEQQGLFLNEIEISIAASNDYDGSHFQQNEERHQLGKNYRSTASQDTFSLNEEGEDSSDLSEDHTLRVTA